MLTGIAIIVAALVTSALIIIRINNKDSAELIATVNKIDDSRRQAAARRAERARNATI